jgi:putative membrane protein
MNEERNNQTPEKDPGKSFSPPPAAQADSDAGGRTGIMKVLIGLASKLGLGHAEAEQHSVETTDIGTKLAHQRTNLAVERNYLAAERTLMGWIRTSLSMISFGFTIGKLGQVVRNIKVEGFLGSMRTVSIVNIGRFLVILGTVVLLAAAFQHRNRVRELRAMGLPYHLSITFIVSLLLAFVGGFALIALVLAL